METLSVIVGFIGTIFGFISFQTKKQEQYLFAQIVANFMVATSFLLLGPERIGGGLLCYAAIFQAVLNYWYARKQRAVSKWSIALFFFVYAAITLVPVFMQGDISIPYSFCPFLCAVFFLAAISAKEGRISRICGMLNSAVWILYDILGTTLAISNLVTHILICVSTIIGILRYDFKFSGNKKTAE